MKPERLQQLSGIYRREVEQSRETILIALCETYREITGIEPNDRMREKIEDALSY